MLKFLKIVALTQIFIMAALALATIASAKEYDYALTSEITAKTALEVKNQLIKLTPDDHLTILIDSPGGSMMASMNICDMLKDRKDVTLKVDHLAASGAALVLLSNENRIVSDSAIVLFHLPYVDIDGEYYMRSYMMNKIQIDWLNINFDFENKLGHDKFMTFALGGDLILMGKDFKLVFIGKSLTAPAFTRSFNLLLTI